MPTPRRSSTRPAPESRAIVDLRRRTGCSSTASSSTPSTARAFKTVNPATEEVLAEVAEAGAADVDRAVRAARRAYDPHLVADARRASAASTCSASPASSRSAPASSRCSSRSTTASPSRSPATSTCRWSPRTSSTTPAGPTSSTTPGSGRTRGRSACAAQVIPWNFPLLMLAWKIAPALAAGNTVVLKPAETTPLSALLFAEICQQADLPPGVVNILTGAGATGRAAGRAPGRRQGRVHRLDRGRQADRRARSPARARRSTLELGGKAANIVFDDAPLDQAVEGIVHGIFFNQGHVCCAGTRLLVQESVADELLRQAEAPDVDAAARRPARQEHRHRRDQLRRAAGQRIRDARRVGEAEGAERWSPPCDAARARASGSPRRSSPASPRRTASPARRSSARCCRCSPSAPRRRRSRRRTTRRTGCPRASGPRRARASSGWRSSCGPAWSGPTPSTSSTRRRRSAATRSPGYGREGGRHGLEAYLDV